MAGISINILGKNVPRAQPKFDGTLDVLRITKIHWFLVRSYKDARTRRFAEGEHVSSFEGFRRQAEKRLRILESATNLRDLALLRSNHLEALTGDRKGQYSIRINKQWRLCFEWPSGADGPEAVEIADYH